MQIPGGVASAATRSGCRLLLGVFLVLGASAEAMGEYQVKAAFLYNFARFVEWPPATFSNDKEPLRICVIGKDPFGGALEEAVRAKTVAGRSLAVSGISEGRQAAGCRILFVSSSEKNRLRAIFRALPPTGILTVGDTEGFAAQGGMVNFKLQDGRIRFEINVEAAERENLRISSKVLTLAEIVKPVFQK
jgi:hypothetical protein